jgi:DNA-binding NtrC family response regulator
MICGCRILVIEDDYFLADDLKQALTALGADVIGPIGNLTAAVKQVGSDGFDVAIVDINLQGEAAYVIADQLEREGIPFGFATGYGAEAIPSRFRNVIRWEKPCDVEQIARDVAQLCPTA